MPWLMSLHVPCIYCFSPCWVYPLWTISLPKVCSNFFLFFSLLSYQPITSLLVTCSMLYANVPFFDLIHLLDAYSMLSFLSDNWGSFVGSLTWAGINVVLAMCSGIPWLNLVFQKIDLEMIKGKKYLCSKSKKNKK